MNKKLKSITTNHTTRSVPRMKQTRTIKSLILSRKLTINRVKALIGNAYTDVDITYVYGGNSDLGRLSIITHIVPMEWAVFVNHENGDPTNTLAWFRDIATFPGMSDIRVRGDPDVLKLEIRYCKWIGDTPPRSTDETLIGIKLLRCALSDSWEKTITNW